MSFKKYLDSQLTLHSSMQHQDMLKLCYQAAFGAEHLLIDMEKARLLLEGEIDCVPAEDTVLFEEISHDYVRVNLSAWKYKKLPTSWLAKIFCASNSYDKKADCVLDEYLDICRTKTNPAEWDRFIEEYKKGGIRPVHHSEQYRKTEKPAYRLVKKSFVHLFPVLELAAEYIGKPCLIAIDGRAASGKTTLAEMLSDILGADIIHMDDFFLPPELRTPERMKETGGNIHYERFAEEVLPGLLSDKSFSYRVFSCGSMDYSGEKEITNANYRIIEGSYSLHPKFGEYADITVFSDVDAEEQRARIEKRNGVKMADIFSKVWIPMEEAYFSHFKIKDKCNLYIKK